MLSTLNLYPTDHYVAHVCLRLIRTSQLVSILIGPTCAINSLQSFTTQMKIDNEAQRRLLRNLEHDYDIMKILCAFFETRFNSIKLIGSPAHVSKYSYLKMKTFISAVQ